jgi:hypothetical protein
MKTQASRKAIPTKAFTRTSEPEQENAVEASPHNQLVAFRDLVETLLKQMQEMRAKQGSTEIAQHAKIDKLQKVVESQDRTILEALHALRRKA